MCRPYRASQKVKYKNKFGNIYNQKLARLSRKIRTIRLYVRGIAEPLEHDRWVIPVPGDTVLCNS